MLTFKQFLILLEDKVDFLKNQYRDKLSTDHDEFAEHQDSDAIVDHLSTASKKYLPWIVKQYQHGNIRQEDVPQIKDTLELFDKHKRNLEKKDISQYQNIGEIRKAINPLLGTAVTRKEQEQHEADFNHQLIHEEPGFKVYHTSSKTASQNFYGGGTKIGKTDWCTSARGLENKFDSHNSKGNMYQIHVKNPDGTESLYQYQPATGEFKDATDTAVAMTNFIKDHPVMKNVLAFKGSHELLPLNDAELTQMIQNGTYTSDHLKHIKKEQMHLMPEALMKKIQSGTYSFRDLNHAENNGYLNKDHSQVLPDVLMKNIQNGTYNTDNLNHAHENYYLTNDHIEALKYAYKKKLKNKNIGLDEIDTAKKYGYFIPQHGTQIQSNTLKWFKKHGMDDLDTTEQYLYQLKKHNLYTNEHEQILKDGISKKFQDSDISDDDFKIANRRKLITPDVAIRKDVLDRIKTKNLQHADLDYLIGNINSPGIHYLLAKSHAGGYSIPEDVIESIANAPNSTKSHFILASSLIYGNPISENAVNAIARNKSSHHAHEALIAARDYGKSISPEAIDSIINNPYSVSAHALLSRSHYLSPQGAIGRNVVDHIAKNMPNDANNISVLHEWLARIHETGEPLSDSVINSISNNPNSLEAHYILADAYFNGKQIPKESIIGISNSPNSTRAHYQLANAHYAGKNMPEDAIIAIAKNPYSEKSHSKIIEWYLDGNHIPNEALLSIAKSPYSGEAHDFLADAYGKGQSMSPEVITSIVSHKTTSSVYVHENLARAFEKGYPLSNEAINSIANSNDSIDAHYFLAKAYKSGRAIPDEVIRTILRNPNPDSDYVKKIIKDQ